MISLLRNVGLGRGWGAAHRPQALLGPLFQQEAAPLHHLGVRQLKGPQDLGQGALRSQTPPRSRVYSTSPSSQHTHLGQLQSALVLDAVVGQGQPEQGAVQPKALEGGKVHEPADLSPEVPWVRPPLRVHARRRCNQRPRPRCG